MSINNPKILVACPTSDLKDYCVKDFIINVRSFTYPADLIMIDNSADKNHIEKFMDMKVDCMWVKPSEKGIKYTIAESQEVMRRYFMRKPHYDYLFSLESDQFPPINILELLLSFNKDVISLPYFVSEGGQSRLLMRKIRKNKKNQLEFYEVPAHEQSKYLTGCIRNDISNNGIGCMLIKRNVLKNIKFRITKDDCYSDTHFHTDIFKQGIDNWLYTGAVSYHKNTTWDIIEELELLNKKT